MKAWLVSQDVLFACLKGVERCAFAFTESKLINCLFVSLFERIAWLSLEMKCTRIIYSSELEFGNWKF